MCVSVCVYACEGNYVKCLYNNEWMGIEDMYDFMDFFTLPCILQFLKYNHVLHSLFPNMNTSSFKISVFILVISIAPQRYLESRCLLERYWESIFDTLPNHFFHILF